MTLADMQTWVARGWARWHVRGQSIVTHTGVIVTLRPDCPSKGVR